MTHVHEPFPGGGHDSRIPTYVFDSGEHHSMMGRYGSLEGCVQAAEGGEKLALLALRARSSELGSAVSGLIGLVGEASKRGETDAVVAYTRGHREEGRDWVQWTETTVTRGDETLVTLITPSTTIDAQKLAAERSPADFANQIGQRIADCVTLASLLPPQAPSVA